MSFLHGDLVVFGTVALASLVGMVWLARHLSAASAAEEMPTLRLPRIPRAERTRRVANDNDDDAPESGIRLKSGARMHGTHGTHRIHGVDSRR